MSRRILDIPLAMVALLATAPLLLIAAVGIRLTSPGPILYRAQRIARDRRMHHRRAEPRQVPDRRQPDYRGREFTMYKFRTMHVTLNPASPITAQNDARVFPFGAFLRAAKIDELPQLFNVLKGDMALVGPRPEAPEIVREYYFPEDIDTLKVSPGLTSPGALYYYTHFEPLLTGGSIVQMYVETLLPIKLAIDRVYIRQASVTYDLRVILRTVRVIVSRLFGGHRFPDPPELAEAGRSMADRKNPRT